MGARDDFEGAKALANKCGPPAAAAAAEHMLSEKATAGAAQSCSRQARRLERLARGAFAAVSFVDSCSAADGLLLPAFLAWRCVQLQSKFNSLGRAAAASSREADLSVVGACSKIGPTPCCCQLGGK